MKTKMILLTVLLLSVTQVCKAQQVLDIIREHPNYAATNYSIYPDSARHLMTPPPAGKKSFYISHYGRHGSRHLNNRIGFYDPYTMLCRADTLGELTPLGRKVLEKVQYIIDDSEDRWGDLTDLGHLQHRHIAHRMMERFPEVFSGHAHVDARSTVVNRCMLSMGSAVQELLRMNPQLEITISASKRDMWYLNYQDKALRKARKNKTFDAAYKDFCRSRSYNPRLMEMLFFNPDSVAKKIDAAMLNYYLVKMALMQENTRNAADTFLKDLFSINDMYQLWQEDNAWWYSQLGFCLLTGGKQPYSQRYLLRKIIEEADSCIQMAHPGASLRFGHETVLMQLVCLLGINGFDYVTDDLEALEQHGWVCSEVIPMGANLQIVFFRTDPDDRDVIFKVLMNEKEATLPIQTDIAPYYHWKDFRQHYLQLLDAYEQSH